MRRQLLPRTRHLHRALGPIAALAVIGLVCASAGAADKDRPPIITKLEVDPAAREVELFDAMKKGELETRLLARNALGGNLLIENKTEEPLTVKMPESFVGIHVHKQIGGMGGMGGMGGGMMGGMGGGMGGMGGGMGGMGGGMGQSMGGGMGGMGGGMGGMGGGMGGMGGMGGGMGGMGGGGGFFSIPAETVARVPYNSVCLEHGKMEPSSRMEYTIVPTDEYTQDETLQALIGLVGTGQLNPQAAQAAAWHLTDNMSWSQLVSMPRDPAIRNSGPYFAYPQVAAARNLVSIAAAQAREQAGQELEIDENTIPRKPIR